MKPFLLEPIPDYTIWGTNHISKARGIDEDYGTWWEVSAHPYCSNKIIGTNKTLVEMIQENPDEVLGKGYTLHETLRLAYLDTKDALSIQVHPEDDYALEHSNDYGKYESWYILDAKPGATLVAGTTINDANEIKKVPLSRCLCRLACRRSLVPCPGHARGSLRRRSCAGENLESARGADGYEPETRPWCCWPGSLATTATRA